MEFNRFASYLEQTFKTEKLNYEAFCAVNRTKLHLECFTLPWQPRQPPGGFSKTAPHTAYKEVHLAPPLSGISWPTLKPSLRNQQAELAWPSFTSHPRSPPYLQRPDVVGKGPPRRAASSKACPRQSTGPFTLRWSHDPICGSVGSPPNTHMGHFRRQWSFGALGWRWLVYGPNRHWEESRISAFNYRLRADLQL